MLHYGDNFSVHVNSAAVMIIIYHFYPSNDRSTVKRSTNEKQQQYYITTERKEKENLLEFNYIVVVAIFLMHFLQIDMHFSSSFAAFSVFSYIFLDVPKPHIYYSCLMMNVSVCVCMIFIIYKWVKRRLLFVSFFTGFAFLLFSSISSKWTEKKMGIRRKVLIVFYDLELSGCPLLNARLVVVALFLLFVRYPNVECRAEWLWSDFHCLVQCIMSILYIEWNRMQRMTKDENQWPQFKL